MEKPERGKDTIMEQMSCAEALKRKQNNLMVANVLGPTVAQEERSPNTQQSAQERWLCCQQFHHICKSSRFWCILLSYHQCFNSDEKGKWENGDHRRGSRLGRSLGSTCWPDQTQSCTVGGATYHASCLEAAIYHEKKNKSKKTQKKRKKFSKGRRLGVSVLTKVSDLKKR